MNHWTVIGNTVQEPEIRYTGQGTCVARVRIAVNRYAGKDKEQETDFFTLSAFGKIAEIIEKCTVAKGTKIACECEIRNYNYTDKNGNKVYSYSFVITRFEFCSSKGNGSAAQSAPRTDYNNGYQGGGSYGSPGGVTVDDVPEFADFGGHGDLPFV